MNYLTNNDNVVKSKNRWITQQIDKKCKNKHHNDYDDCGTKNWTKKNRNYTKQLSKLSQVSFKPKTNRSKSISSLKPKKQFEISIDICLYPTPDKKVTQFKNCSYTMIKYQLKHITINTYDTSNKIAYSSYKFSPCYKYNCHSDEYIFDIDCIYQVRNDIHIPVFFDNYNIETDSINVNKPLLHIVNQCWDLRNPKSLSLVAPQWKRLCTKQNKNNDSICITFVAVLKFDNTDAIKFKKYKPFSKKEMNALNVYDTIKHKQLYWNYITSKGHNTYYNLPIVMVPFVNEMVPDEKSEIEMKNKDKKYWLCHSCFTINSMGNNNKFECIYCNKVSVIPKNIYEVGNIATTSHIISNIIKMVHSYKDANPSECIVNRSFASAFMDKYIKLRNKYKNIDVNLSKPSIVYHWTRSEWFDSIKKIGLIVPDNKRAVHKTDKGYYGRGIYTSPSHTYARYYGNCGKVFVCLCLTGKKYAASYPSDFGAGLKNGFDSHYSSDRNQMEWVFFDTSQLLLLYLIDYTKINEAFIEHLNNIIAVIIGNKKLNSKLLRKIKCGKGNHVFPMTCAA